MSLAENFVKSELVKVAKIFCQKRSSAEKVVFWLYCICNCDSHLVTDGISSLTLSLESTSTFKCTPWKSTYCTTLNIYSLLSAIFCCMVDLRYFIMPK